jgi:gamma-glutamylcyclotransferase
MITVIKQRLLRKFLREVSKFPSSHSVLYFGYGANIDPDFFKKRIPQAELVGVGSLQDHIFKFNLPCEYVGKGFGGVEYLQGEVVFGSLYKLPSSTLIYLDILEWVPFNFYKRSILKIDHGPAQVEAFVYVPCTPRKGLLPSKGYRDLIIQGAKKVNLPSDYIRYLEGFSFSADFILDYGFNLSNPSRKRFLSPKFYRIHDNLREKLCNLI